MSDFPIETDEPDEEEIPHLEDILDKETWRDPDNIFNLGAVIILALVAMATAWAGYQSARYGGLASEQGNRAATLRTEALALSSAANDKLIIDLTIFSGWLDAALAEKEEVADFYRERMRQEFAVAFDAWQATSPAENLTAPSSPFAMAEYVISEQVDSEEKQLEVEEALELQNQYNERGDGFLFVSVLLALVLFFVTMAQRFETPRYRFIVAAMGLLVLIWALTLLSRLTLA